jgi:hypothetical protein
MKRIKANSYYYKGRWKKYIQQRNSLTPPTRETDIRGDQEKNTQRIRQHADNIQAIANGVNHAIHTRDDGVHSAEPPGNIKDR